MAGHVAQNWNTIYSNLLLMYEKLDDLEFRYYLEELSSSSRSSGNSIVLKSSKQK